MTDTPLARLDYVELQVDDLERGKAFYQKAFGWAFEDYGPDYAAFTNAGLDGGLARVDGPKATNALIVLKSDDLEALEESVSEAGGQVGEKLNFPGGRRFHFTDPAGNELAIWSDIGEYDVD